MVVAIIKLKGYDVSSADLSYLSTFPDAESISEWVRDYVAIAVVMGIIKGFADGTFRGQATLTRAQAAVMLWRAFMMESCGPSGATDSTNGGRTDGNEETSLGGSQPGGDPGSPDDAAYPDRDLEIVLYGEKYCIVLGELMQAVLMDIGQSAVLMVVDREVFIQLLGTLAYDAVICDISIIEDLNGSLGETIYIAIPCIENNGITLCVAVHKDAAGLDGIIEEALESLIDTGAINIVLDYWDN